MARDNPLFSTIKFCPFNFLGCCRRELGIGPDFMQMRKAREAAGIDLFLIQITITVRDQAVKPGLHMLGKSQTIGDFSDFAEILDIRQRSVPDFPDYEFGGKRKERQKSKLEHKCNSNLGDW